MCDPVLLVEGRPGTGSAHAFTASLEVVLRPMMCVTVYLHREIPNQGDSCHLLPFLGRTGVGLPTLIHTRCGDISTPKVATIQLAVFDH